MNATYTYQQIRDRLLKYKKAYEQDLTLQLGETNKAYIRGNIHMINVLLDDLDSESGIAWLGADFAEPPKPHKTKICGGSCQKCLTALQIKQKLFNECESILDAKVDYEEFIENCKKENNVDS